jgi:hypothetical protein
MRHVVPLPGQLSPTLASAVDTWATVGVAIGTIGAVAYALFRDLVVTPRHRPSLELRFDRAGNDQIIVGTTSGSEAAQVRLRVGNRRKDTADEVVVLVTELLPDSQADARPIHLPLTWSGTNPPLTVSAIHPGSERHVDLLHVDLPAGDEAVPLHLDVNPEPAGDEDILDPGTYEISIEIRARNADALRYAVSIGWDGMSSDRAATWEHLRVEPPRKVR